jgi:hypothetical protein
MAILGLAGLLLLVAGAIVDVLAFDQTLGGYEPPYTEYSGEPIDWGETYQSLAGMYRPGVVVDTHVDCTSGMISFDLFGLSFDYRQLSERALAVHQPREACFERGFNPRF